MRLLDYLRPALRESREVQAIQEGFQAAVDGLWNAVEGCMAQLDVETATWGLSIWEEALGLPVEVERPMAFRRSRIKVHFVGAACLPPNLGDLMAAVRETIPAHLAGEYSAKIKLWRDVKDLNWNEVKEQNWGWLRGEIK